MDWAQRIRSARKVLSWSLEVPHFFKESAYIMVQFHAIHLFVMRQKRMLNFSWNDTITDCVRPYGGTSLIEY